MPAHSDTDVWNSIVGRPGQHEAFWHQGRDLTIHSSFQAGNQVGEAFWNMLLVEHGLDQSGVSVIHRRVLVDAEARR